MFLPNKYNKVYKDCKPMSDIENVFRPHDPSKPRISINFPSKEELIANILGLIPGYRALKNFHDNPEGPISETIDLAAEDIVPFYNAIKNGDDIGDYLNELAMAAVPIGRLSSVGRVNRTFKSRPDVDVPAGPHRNTNTGSNIVSTGRQLIGTNSVPTGKHTGIMSGKLAYQGDMYPAGRSLRKDDMYGPFEWEDAYSRKLNDIIDENEYKWEYLLNKTRQGRERLPNGRPGRKPNNPVRKDVMARIAIDQGRPDIAERILTEDVNTPYKSIERDPKFRSYRSNQNTAKLSDREWKDIGNRQVEKELRETFAMLPEDDAIRYRFADYYGTPDLYESWKKEPNYWHNYKADVNTKRMARELGLDYYDNKYRPNAKK